MVIETKSDAAVTWTKASDEELVGFWEHVRKDYMLQNLIDRGQIIIYNEKLYRKVDNPHGFTYAKNDMTDKEHILSLKDGEHYIVPESDYGKAEIVFIMGYYFLFEIPMYGGTPSYVDAFTRDKIDDMIAKYESWS